MVYDIITIGSATIDIFLKSKSKEIEIEEIHSHKDICMPIGSKIIVDKLVTDTGGGGTNTAVSFARMGFKTGWIGKIGNDINSRTIQHELKREKVDILGSKGKGASGLSVILTGYEKNRTILAYKGVNDELTYGEVKKAKTKWYYLASMTGKSWKTANELLKKSKTPLAFNPSIYLARKGMNALKQILDRTNILILNKEEAQALSRQRKEENYLDVLQKKIPLLVVTDGPKGAIAYNGIEKYRLRVPKQKIVETTGAGDSFASAFVGAIIKNKTIEEALLIAYKQASSVITEYGAKNNLLNWKELQKKTKAKVIK